MGAVTGFWAGFCGACFEGLTSHASSSKPCVSFLGGAGARASGVSVRSSALSSLDSFWLNLLALTTSSLWTAGAGRPLRVLFLSVPPGPEKRPPPALSGDVTPRNNQHMVALHRTVCSKYTSTTKFGIKVLHHS